MGESISALEVSFSIAEPTPYLFHGSIAVAGGVQCIADLGGIGGWQHALGLALDDQTFNFEPLT